MGGNYMGFFKVWVTIAKSYVHHPFLLLFWDRGLLQHITLLTRLVN